MTTNEAPAGKRMRLRYAGTCRECGARLDAGQHAAYFRAEKAIECLSCAGGVVAVTPRPSSEPVREPHHPAQEPPADTGSAGASARREYERRAAKRAERVRSAHPKLGGLILALSEEPQSTRAWDRGARGEELLTKRLDALSDRGVLLPHDRRIPGSRANIDHMAVSAAGIFVIDAKCYAGRPHLRVEGGLLRPRTETLLVGRRDCTKLLAGMTRQTDLVRAVLARQPEFAGLPVRGMLCFVEADWPLIGGAFTIGGVDVLWPAKAAEKITAAGPLPAKTVSEVHRHIATAFPTA